MKSLTLRGYRPLLLLLGLLCGKVAQAAVPSALTADGVLTSQGGGPVADGNYAVTFSIYKNDAGGSSVWSEGPLQVAVKNGAFSQALGTTNPVDASVAAAGGWITLAVGNDPELARKPWRSVPFALWAQVAEGLECSGCVKAGMLADDVSSSFAKKAELSPVATSGNYSDLKGIPLGPKPGDACQVGMVVTGIGLDGKLQCTQSIGAQGAIGLPKASKPPFQCTASGTGAMYFDNNTIGIRYCTGQMWQPLGSACGNGVIDSGEQCDDGNASTVDGCLPTCIQTGVCTLACKSANTVAQVALEDVVVSPAPEKGATCYPVAGSGTRLGLSCSDTVAAGATTMLNGRAYIFDRQANGKWTLAKTLQAEPVANAVLSSYLRGFDDTVAVMSTTGNMYGTSTPVASVAITEVVAGQWVNTGNLEIPQPYQSCSIGLNCSNSFGYSVAHSGNLLALTQPGWGPPTATYAGAVHVYSKQPNGSWMLDQSIQAPKPQKDGSFGSQVKLAGNILAAGASKANEASPDAWAVYLFEYQGAGKWPMTGVVSEAPKDSSYARLVGLTDTSLEIIVLPVAGKQTTLKQYSRLANGTWAKQSELQFPVISYSPMVDSHIISNDYKLYSKSDAGTWSLVAVLGTAATWAGTGLATFEPSAEVGGFPSAGRTRVFQFEGMCDSEGLCVCNLGWSGPSCADKIP